jgi:hypothetical protein
VIIFLTLGIFSTLHSEASQGRQNHQTPKDTYLRFRELVKNKQYHGAYALLDGNAKAEFRAAATELLRMAMAPAGSLENASDFETFRLFVSNQPPHEFEFISEEIEGDTAVINGQIRQGSAGRRSAVRPVKIILKKASGAWLIHSPRGRLLQNGVRKGGQNGGRRMGVRLTQLTA